MSLDRLIDVLGLPGVVIGTVLEGDAITFLGGVLAHRHYFPFEAVALAATLGAVLADNLFFGLGRFARQGRFVRHILSRGAVQTLHARLDRHPVPAILGFRFLYGMKTAGAVMIGTTAVRWPRFALLDLAACLVWAHLLAGIGFVAGHAVHELVGRLELHWHLALTGGLFLAAAAALWLAMHRRKPKGPPG